VEVLTLSDEAERPKIDPEFEEATEARRSAQGELQGAKDSDTFSDSRWN
jgi:hypothetical protein